MLLRLTFAFLTTLLIVLNSQGHHPISETVEILVNLTVLSSWFRDETK